MAYKQMTGLSIGLDIVERMNIKAIKDDIAK